MSFFISKNTWRSRRRTHQTQAHQTCGKADGNVDKDIIFYHDLVWICFWQWHYFQWWSYLDLLVFVKVSHNRSQLICVHEEAHHVQDSAFSDQESKKYPLHFPHLHIIRCESSFIFAQLGVILRPVLCLLKNNIIMNCPTKCNKHLRLVPLFTNLDGQGENRSLPSWSLAQRNWEFVTQY